MARRRRTVAPRNSSPLVPVTTEPKKSDNEEVNPEDQDEVAPATQEDASVQAQDAATPAQDSEAPEAASPPMIQTIPRRKRLGRPPKNRPPDWDLPDPNAEPGSEGGTPFKRRRGRPSMGRGRGRGGAAQVSRVPVDKEGTMMDVVGDEVAVPEDPEGETKVDKMGNLLGGREYRVRVFTITGRGDRLYMLSTEPARCTGFRDSYLFFTKHLQLFKVIINDDEKRDLIEREVIPHSYKGRAIGVVTARSVFREFGARIVVGGKKIMDDYHADAARSRGDVEGELADPQDQLPAPGEPYNKNQYVAWHGASAVYHTNTPTVPLANANRAATKRKIAMTSENWKYEHVMSALEFNRQLNNMRRKVQEEGSYNIHTNLVHRPKNTQPTCAKWEEVPPAQSTASMTNGEALTNGSIEENGDMANADQDPKSKFPPVPAIVSRNALVVDTHMSTPPFTTTSGRSGVYGGPNLTDIPQDQVDLLPPECRAAFEDAMAKQDEWLSQWGTEEESASRGNLKIGF